jgi:hypothetical protein
MSQAANRPGNLSEYHSGFAEKVEEEFFPTPIEISLAGQFESTRCGLPERCRKLPSTQAQ